MKLLYLTLPLLFYSVCAYAQQDSTAAVADSMAQDTSSVLKKGYVKFLPCPVIASSPSNGFMYGVGGGCYWQMGEPANTGVSNALGSVVYTTMKQLLTSVKSYMMFSENKWVMMTDVRYLATSQPTYGLGTGPQSAKPVSNGFIEYTDNPYTPIPDEQMMEFSYFRVHQTVNRRIKNGGLYVGLGYHLDSHFDINDHLLSFDTLPNVITSHYAYQHTIGMSADKYITSGFSLNLQYDTRDNQVNPYKGRYAYFNVRVNPEFLGSNKNSALYWIESREYIHLSKNRPRHLIGFWNFGWFSTGDVPYLDLPALGWDFFGRSGRGYTQGRFRGQELIYNEIEYRIPLQVYKERFGAVAFINGTTAGGSIGNVRLFDYYDIGYGVGIRFMISIIFRANVNLDYAFGNYGSQGFYLGINEAF